MAEDRVRQLVAWQLKQIEARNRRSEQDRFREQEYFRMFQYSDGEPSGYRDENQNIGDGFRLRRPSGVGSPLVDSVSYSVASSRHSLLDDLGSCTENLGSMPNIVPKGTRMDQSPFMYHSVPSGLHSTFASDPDSPRDGEPNEMSPSENPPKQPVGDRTEDTPSGGFQRNFGIRRSRSFSGHPDIRTKSDLETPKEARRQLLRRRDFYGSTPALSSHMISHMGWMGGDVFDGILSPPPPVENRPLSPSSISFPLSSWSSASSITGNWQSRKIEEEVEGESKKTVILAKQKAFNENCCMRCFSRFIFIINQKVQCYQCKYYVCKNCSQYDGNRREYVCNVCKKQRELQNQSLNWFYDSVKNKFKRFGSAKVVRSLYKRRLDSDSESEIHHQPSTYNSEPIGRRSRQGLHGLFEMDLDQPDKEIRNEEEQGKEDREKKRCPSSCFSTPYSCPVGTGRETFDQVKEAELNTYRNHLPCIIESIHCALDTYSPTPGEIHKQERNLLSEQKSQLVSLLLSLSQSLHIAVDNQDPTQNVSSPVAKHQLVNDILVSEVERFTGRPVTLASVTKDGTQSCEEQLANIILNKIIDDYHQKTLQRAKEEESDVRQTFARLSNHATLEQIKDKYVSGSETDMTSSQLDEPMSDVENQSMDRSYTAYEPASEFVLANTKSVNTKLANGLQAREGQGKDMIITTEKSVQSPRDSDSGIVSSPTAESMTSLRQGSEESEDQIANQALVNGGIPGQQREGVMKTGAFVESSEWNVITQITVKDKNSNFSAANIPFVPDEELDDIVTNNLINEKWSVVESRASCVLSDDDDDKGEEALAVKKSAKGALNKTKDVFNSNSEEVNSRLSQMKRDFAKNKSIPITCQEHSEEISSLTDSDVTIDEAKVSPEDEEDEDKSFDADRVRVPLPSFSTSHRLSFESGDLDDISSFHCNDDEDNISTFSTEISFGRTWNFSHTEGLFRDSGKISAYDNFGEKKVGRDIEGPVIMLVPDGPDKSTTVKVGDRDLDELSDLSENLTHSDATPEGSDDDQDEGLDDDNIGDDDGDGYPSKVKDRRRKSTNEDSESATTIQKHTSQRQSAGPRDVQKGTKTDAVHGSSEKTDAADKTNSAESKPTITAEELLALEVVSTEKEESDPKFLLRPTDVTVMEGEVATFCCKVTGTEPIDVFWHKEGQEIVQLNDNESCDTRYDDSTYYLDIYNTRRYDQSQILCIGVNDSGRCVQGVRLFVQENPGDKKAPEFLKPLHDVYVKVGARVKFRVKLSGYPQPKVNWYKDGKKLKSCEQCKLEKHGNRDYVLCINYATLDDDAEYTIVAKNIVGEARSSAQLVVDEGGSDGEFSSLGSSRISLPLSPQPTQTAAPLPAADPCPSDNVGGLYPDTEELLKLADKVSQTRGDVTTTASKMLRSAGQMSTLHQQLDEMDRKLNAIETEVKDADHVSMETNAYKELYREQILQEHEEMQTSASAVRNITSATINLLQSTSDIIESNKESQGLKRKSELISVAPSTDKEEDLVELKLTFLEFEKLYNVGKITREQMRSGMVPRSVYDACMQYLRAEAAFKEQSEKSHDLVLNDLPASVDCGLKRIDSKRYKRDYIINKDKSSNHQKSSDMRRGSGSSSDIVKSTPAGLREDPHEKISEAQEQIYLAAGRVSHLQEKIEHLEDKVTAADDGSVADLEDQVAKTAAQVKSSEEKVSLVEQQIRALESLTKKVEKEPVKVKRRSSSSASDHSAPVSIQSDSQPQTTSGGGTRQKVTQSIKLKPLVMPNSMNQSHDAKTPTDGNKTDVKTPPSSARTPPATIKTPPADIKVPSASVKATPAATKTAPANVQTAPAAPKTPPVAPPVVKSPEPVKSALKLKPESIDLHGETPEDVLPESRTEIEPSFSLPSVKSLKSKFDHSSTSGAEKDGASNFKRVYSLTGRDLPRTVREKLKAQGPRKVINPNIRSADGTQPQSLLSVFERSDGDLNEPRSSTPILNTSQQDKTQQDEKVKSSTSLNLSHVSNIEMQSPSSSDTKMNVSTAKGSERRVNAEPESTSQSQSNPTSPKDMKLNRRKSSTILARAAFWDSRINQEVVSDTQADVEKFPQMPVENFKSMNSTL